MVEIDGGLMERNELARVARAPDAHLREVSDEAKRFQMAPGLHTRTQNRQTETSARASRSVATAETAAVRISVISRPSMTTSGSPVSGRKRRIMA